MIFKVISSGSDGADATGAAGTSAAGVAEFVRRPRSGDIARAVLQAAFGGRHGGSMTPVQDSYFAALLRQIDAADTENSATS